MEYQQLNQKLQELNAEKAEVERTLAAMRNDRKKELVAEFKARLAQEGFDVEDICGSGKGRGRRAGAERIYPTYVANDDPNYSYVRGPLPGWMKDKMAAIGLDPGNKKDRETFKSDYMTVQ